jgi:hypothetical protein
MVEVVTVADPKTVPFRGGTIVGEIFVRKIPY